MARDRTYTTSQLADAAGVGSQTLRYYERRGLLPDPPRTSGGHRIYSAAHLERLRFIQDARTLGFELRQVRVMLDLLDGERTDIDTTLEQSLLAAIDEKMTHLVQLRRRLTGSTPPEE